MYILPQDCEIRAVCGRSAVTWPWPQALILGQNMQWSWGAQESGPWVVALPCLFAPSKHLSHQSCKGRLRTNRASEIMESGRPCFPKQDTAPRVRWGIVRAISRARLSSGLLAFVSKLLALPPSFLKDDNVPSSPESHSSLAYPHMRAPRPSGGWGEEMDTQRKPGPMDLSPKPREQPSKSADPS